MPTPPVIGITLGDPNGIGPEVSWKALLQLAAGSDTRWVLVGDPASLKTWIEPESIPLWEPGPTAPAQQVSIWNPSPPLNGSIHPGVLDPLASRAAYTWIEHAVAACQAKFLDAIVTAPINKEGFRRAGIDVPGHTELLARLTRTERFGMMLMGGPLRVLLVTRHLPIRDVADALSIDLILDSIALAHEARPWFTLQQGPIAVCGLNPHAGDGGTIGHEDLDIIAPAIAAAKKRGINAQGPLPADTVFHFAAKGRYAAVVCMYHDQGLGPLKMLAFDEGVNLTLGLPILRTSPDHGTAFDIAGQNKARPDSMVQAMRCAERLSSLPNPWS